MEENNIPLKTKFLKSKCRVANYMLTQSLILKQENIEVMFKEDIVLMWLLAEHHLTNWI